MIADSANLTLPQDQNWTSAVGYCSRPVIIVQFILDFVFVVYSFPANTVVFMELLQRKCKKRHNVSSSSSLLEVFLLHISSVNVFYCVYLLMVLLEQLNVWQVNQFYAYVLYCPGFTLVPLFLLAICFDCYLAVVHPVVYRAAKKLHHRVLLYTMSVWVCAFIIWLIIVIYKLSVFHPINMLAFYVCLPTVVLFNISTLRVLYFAGPGNTNQMLSATKRRPFRILLIMLVAMLVYYLPMITFYTYRFIVPTTPEVFSCLEVPLVMLVPKMCRFAAPIVFLYSLGKLGA